MQYERVEGTKLAYVEQGAGEPIVFLHGNPTSSYLWRNVMPHVVECGRCIAPDLPGMGQSEKLADSGPGTYRFADHYRYLSALLDALSINARVTLVLHDWGSALGFHWAHQHPEKVAGIAYMEAIVRPLSWSEWPAPSKRLFEGLRGSKGEELILEKNVFIERILPGSILRQLTEQEMEAYRAPYREPGEGRRPMLAWPRELPIDGKPADVVEIVQQYADWMSFNDIPKLFINAEPGAILTGATRDYCRAWQNQTEVTVPGIHFIQEDSPNEIGMALKNWMTEHVARASADGRSNGQSSDSKTS